MIEDKGGVEYQLHMPYQLHMLKCPLKKVDMKKDVGHRLYPKVESFKGKDILKWKGRKP